MTTAITFSRQNDAGSRASTTNCWENLVLVVFLVLEIKGLYWLERRAPSRIINGKKDKTEKKVASLTPSRGTSSSEINK